MLLNVYNRYDVTFEKGEGTYIYDNKGNKYLDFVSGISVNCLGHSSPIIVEALTEQSKKLIHISNLYYSEPQLNLAKKLTENSEMEKVFFTNSGTEAVELAIKIARKFGRNISENKTEIIYMTDSFHGRSTGSLAITGQNKYKEPFEPLISNITECKFNDSEDLIRKVSDNTAAIILEPVQGESGLEEVTSEFIEKIKELKEKYNILVIFDEIQCGMGRMGTLFAYEQFNLIPDVITIAKSLGGGVPIGACLTKGIANEVLTPGDHGSTYGGNPLVCAVGNAVLKELIDNNLIKNNVIEMGKYAKEKLENLRSKIDFIVEIRGKGLLLGIKLDSSKVLSKDFVAFALEKGLLLVGAGNNVVRYFPPFNVCKAEIDKSIKILEEVVGKF
ncbi:MAG: aspartate aminotransferase family protein [Leptotrichiaceae bacterium]|nr:aspartate aminotransferase family protein [Leptotrichiaceae bacterium]MBP6281392.1 aspartate aminotransferase family protein [Leptotrichiaceae bacterium]MBP7725161.1 aspartate aminotransferase family protein [Leptotrichiaceae bacterium]MBP9629156.1 aspartate aminotransferase family protein [Leptotrichiaceae bacterium]